MGWSGGEAQSSVGVQQGSDLGWSRPCVNAPAQCTRRHALQSSPMSHGALYMLQTITVHLHSSKHKGERS